MPPRKNPAKTKKGTIERSFFRKNYCSTNWTVCRKTEVMKWAPSYLKISNNMFETDQILFNKCKMKYNNSESHTEIDRMTKIKQSQSLDKGCYIHIQKEDGFPSPDKRMA